MKLYLLIFSNQSGEEKQHIKINLPLKNLFQEFYVCRDK